MDSDGPDILDRLDREPLCGKVQQARDNNTRGLMLAPPPVSSLKTETLGITEALCPSWGKQNDDNNENNNDNSDDDDDDDDDDEQIEVKQSRPLRDLMWHKSGMEHILHIKSNNSELLKKHTMVFTSF